MGRQISFDRGVALALWIKVKTNQMIAVSTALFYTVNPLLLALGLTSVRTLCWGSQATFGILSFSFFSQSLKKSIAHTDGRIKTVLIVSLGFDGKPAFHFKIWCGLAHSLIKMAIFKEVRWPRFPGWLLLMLFRECHHSGIWMLLMGANLQLWAWNSGLQIHRHRQVLHHGVAPLMLLNILLYVYVYGCVRVCVNF